ncbi:hypothetical protein G7Z17_g11111 [Cylindrodendrum hubeiense]|uniref:Alpha-galactosidase n=1 Tax=Cylindrodendrum hubeiense TaxID=595255 RepID=A0A9P5H3K2_9HYPO|nr:hypothetical protein G7Z17_g11111 [Cylindrodendrum hubeiense]
MPSDNYDFGEVFQAIYIAKQKPSPPPVAENMKATLQSNPPLGQVTPVQGKDVHLAAILEIPKSRATEPWEVCVWHSVDGSEWKETKLGPVEESQTPQTLQLMPESMSRFYFASSFSFDASVQFTLKFRHDPHEEWRWIRDEQGLDDGWIVQPTAGISSDKLTDLIPDLNSNGWTVSSCLSQSPGTVLWALQAPIPPAEGDNSTYKDISVGTPWGSFSRWFALARNDGLSDENAIILVSEGDNFESAVAAVMRHARTLVAQAKQSSLGQDEDEELAALASDFKPEWMENCLIIDDNWQSIDYRGPSQFQYGWKEFEAEPVAFPKGLKATISHIREKHPHIQHIAVWHALLGYWGGLAPDGKIAQTYKTIEVDREDADRRNLPLGGKMTVVAKDDVFRFYNDFYRFLSDCGIDAVKTDAQFMIDTWIGASARRELIIPYLNAWTISTLRHFSARAISCMSQIPQALFHSQMPTNRPAILVRNSDDFFPEIPSSHPWHVWTNAHNSIFMEHLNVLPDWDMFQTVHEYSGFHAAARCVSGGPIYITDVPGKHDMDLIGQMTGLTPRGKTVIFRPSVLGKTVYPYMGYDDDSLLKVGSYHGASSTGSPILAIFNISSRPLTEIIPLSSFPRIDASIDKKHGTILTSNLGLLGKMAGPAAIFTSKIEQFENGRVLIDTRIKAFGTLGIYVSALPSMTIEGDFLVTIQEKPIPAHTVTISKADNYVVEIDLGKAWEEMGLESRWSNEIEVKVYFSS